MAFTCPLCAHAEADHAPMQHTPSAGWIACTATDCPCWITWQTQLPDETVAAAASHRRLMLREMVASGLPVPLRLLTDR